MLFHILFIFKSFPFNYNSVQVVRGQRLPRGVSSFFQLSAISSMINLKEGPVLRFSFEEKIHNTLHATVKANEAAKEKIYTVHRSTLPINSRAFRVIFNLSACIIMRARSYGLLSF